MNLTTKYLGLKLKNPVVAAASPLSAKIDTVKQLEDAGAGAIVLHSLFEEQIRFEAEELHHYTTQGTESYAESTSYFPEPADYRLGPEEYLDHIRKTKQTVGIPIIASLNGSTTGGWTDYAQKMQQAGADALELNIYYVATELDLSAQQVEDRYINILKAVKNAVSIPVSIKLSPFFSAIGGMCKRLDESGADGLVLFNRFYQPDFDLENLEVVPNLVLSNTFETRLPMRWIAILHGRINASLAATRGIASGIDLAKVILAGADVAQVCSVLLRKGPAEISVMLRDLQSWMEEKEYESVEMMCGAMSQKSAADPAAFERANYMKALNSYV